MHLPIYASKTAWIYIIMAYLFLASVMPMWLLMQPRDYMTTFMLLGMIIGAVLGVVVAHPDMDPSGELTLSTMGLQPYYNTTERMKRGFLNSHGLERLMKNALALLQEPLAETLPPQLVEEHHLMSLDEAIRNIHFPKNPELLRKANIV